MPADATVEASSIEPQSSTARKLLPDTLYFQHVADKPLDVPAGFQEYLGPAVQHCRDCGCFLSLGPKFFEVGEPIYTTRTFNGAAGVPVLTVSQPRPRSRFIVPCYRTVSGPAGHPYTLSQASWKLDEVFTVPVSWKGGCL
jgi:hypothetical protein